MWKTFPCLQDMEMFSTLLALFCWNATSRWINSRFETSNFNSTIAQTNNCPLIANVASISQRSYREVFRKLRSKKAKHTVKRKLCSVPNLHNNALHQTRLFIFHHLYIYYICIHSQTRFCSLTISNESCFNPSIDARWFFKWFVVTTRTSNLPFCQYQSGIEILLFRVCPACEEVIKISSSLRLIKGNTTSYEIMMSLSS